MLRSKMTCYRLFIPSSKTDQSRDGAWIVVASSGKATCPVAIVLVKELGFPAVSLCFASFSILNMVISLDLKV